VTFLFPPKANKFSGIIPVAEPRAYYGTSNNMKINKTWHLKNKMPKNPTLEQRIKWHKAHAKNCQCRTMSAKLKAEIKNLKK
jgi:hypothetical protein